jgi:hypothetical protein
VRLEIEDCQPAGYGPDFGVRKKKRAEAGRVEFSHVTEIQDQARQAGLEEPLQIISKLLIAWAQNKISFEIENIESLVLALDNFK